jgi:hypothetical protein
VLCPLGQVGGYPRHSKQCRDAQKLKELDYISRELLAFHNRTSLPFVFTKPISGILFCMHLCWRAGLARVGH